MPLLLPLGYPFCGLVGSLLFIGVSETSPEAGDGGKAPGIFEEPLSSLGVVGCDVRGPPSEVGGLGVCGGESGGAGMFVPSVSENSTGMMVSGLKSGGAIAVVVIEFWLTAARRVGVGRRTDESFVRESS